MSGTTPTTPWIDQHQARVFVGIGIAVTVSFFLVLTLWGKRPITIGVIEPLVFPLGLGVSGTASSVVILWLLSAHDSDWWGNAKGAISFIAMGGVLSFLASLIQLLKAFAAVL